jgi:hypothetical protein
MKRVALEKCETLLAKANTLFKAMENADTLNDVCSAWSDFLVTSQRIHTMLEQGAKGTNKSYAWWGEKRHERRTVPLLRYAHHARNADEHGLAEITKGAGAQVAFGVGPGRWRIDMDSSGITVEAKGGQVSGESKFVESKPARVVLVRIFDKGDAYDPPTSGLEPLTPVEASRGILDHLSGMIEEAKQLAE